MLLGGGRSGILISSRNQAGKPQSKPAGKLFLQTP
jgi:hypothetical protein